MNIDWSGEFGATHCDIQGLCFYKLEGDTWKLHLGNDEWCNSYSMYNGDTKVSDLIQRHKPKPWSGPEDGLPPVGTVCEYLEDGNGDWEEVTIVAIDHRLDYQFAVFHGDKGYSGDRRAELFREIPTPDQKRETAIREIMDIAQVDCRVTAARLVDAGFKR